ncbi:hypothetical protein CUT44_14120 [Streptomyces carminius]|uniref:Uncharacterized protein n=1 Tax=Streptomyces carminius TaxID=2665496 RepID=A0A2M8LYW4_9ACTN|nr:hypothetical protein [Streptomyces carminius]PJE97114.1 hypothetical protein CUT44_14120 [Streptomyces carminius]
MITLVKSDVTGQTATFHRFEGGALYKFTDADETIHVQPTYLGQPEREAVTISLGSPTDRSGYRLTGLSVGDYLLTGVVMCAGPGLTPCPHPQAPTDYPLPDIQDEATRADAADLLCEIAQHFYSLAR